MIVGKVVAEELETATGDMLLVFEDGTGVYPGGSEVTAEQVGSIRRHAIESAELSWLYALEDDWYRNVATCEQRRDWVAREGDEPKPTKKRRADDAAYIDAGFYSTAPVYCETCGETFCAGGKDGSPGPNRDLHSILRVVFRPEAFEGLYDSSLLDGLT